MSIEQNKITLAKLFFADVPENFFLKNIWLLSHEKNRILNLILQQLTKRFYKALQFCFFIHVLFD